MGHGLLESASDQPKNRAPRQTPCTVSPDTLRGDGGDDTLNSGADANSMDGGAGVDGRNDQEAPDVVVNCE